MRKLMLLIGVLFTVHAMGQVGSVSGKIVNENKEPLEGVTVKIDKTEINTITNSEGVFQFKSVPVGKYTLLVTYVGKATLSREIDVIVNATLSVPLELNEQQNSLNEVVVKGTSNRKYIRTTSEFASRQNIPLRDLPQSIQAIPRQIILDQQAYRMNELFKNVAGATEQSDWNYVMMRGFLTNSSNFLVNGQRGGFVGEDQFAQLSFIERAEVLKGPSSVLFGNGAVGGTFNLITKKPKEDSYVAANIATGSFGLLRVQADVNGALDKKKKLLGLLNIGLENGGNFYQDFRNRNALITPFFTWKLGQRIEISSMTVLRAAEQTTSYATGIPVIGNDLYAAPFDFKYASEDGNYSSRSIQQQFKISHSFNSNWSGTVWANYSKRKDDVYIYAAGTASPRLDSISRSLQVWEADIRGLAINAYINGSFRVGKVENNLVIGFDYLNKKDDYPIGFNYYFVPAINQNNPVYPRFDTAGKVPDYFDSDEDVIKTRTYGFYVQDQVKFGKKWQALLALRYDYFDYDYFSAFGAGFGGGTYTDTLQSSALVPRIGLVYQPNSRISIYGSYMQGFNPQTTSAAQGGPFPPERANQIELGAKGEFLGGRLIPTLAIYQITKNNVLNGDPNDPSGLRRVVTGKARSRGVEFTLAGMLTREWNVIANYAHNQTITLKDTDPSKEGQLFGDTPSDMFTIWTTYRLDRVVKGLRLGGGFRTYSDKKVFGADFKGYSVLDLMAAYQYKKFSLNLNVNNVLDERYLIGAWTNTASFPGPPRNVVVSIGYNW